MLLLSDQNNYEVGVKQMDLICLAVALTALALSIALLFQVRSMKNRGWTIDKPFMAVRLYVVERGDTVEKIAEKELGDKYRFREIVKLNNLCYPLLFVGQIIMLPGIARTLPEDARYHLK